jgi:O-antigen ligase
MMCTTIGLAALAAAPLVFVASGTHRDYILPKVVLLDIAGISVLLASLADPQHRLGTSRAARWLWISLTAYFALTAAYLPLAANPAWVVDRLVSAGRWGMLLAAGVWLGEERWRSVGTLAVVAFGGTVNALVGITQAIVPQALSLDQRDGYGLTFFHSNLAAQYMLVVLFAAVVLALSDRRIQRWGGIGSLALITIGIVLLGRRGVWGGALVGGIIVLFSLWRQMHRAGRRYGRTLLIVLSLGTGLVAGATVVSEHGSQESVLVRLRRAATFSDASYAYRKQLIQASLTMIAAHPLTGAAPGHWRLEFPQCVPPASRPGLTVRESALWRIEHAHNDFLELLADYGVLGGMSLLAALASALFVLWRALGRAARTEDSDRAHWFTTWRVVLPAMWGATLLNALVNFPLHSELPSGLLWLLTGVAAGSLSPSRCKDPVSVWARVVTSSQRPSPSRRGVRGIAMVALVSLLLLLLLRNDFDRWRYSVCLARGKSLFAAGQIAMAASLFARAHHARPAEAGGQFYLARIAATNNDTAAALELIQEALRYQPNLSDLWRLRAAVLAGSAWEHPNADSALETQGAALQAVNRAVALAPYDEDALLMQAELLVSLKRYELALDPVESLLLVYPYNGRGWELLEEVNLAASESGTGRTGDALQELAPTEGSVNEEPGANAVGVTQDR